MKHYPEIDGLRAIAVLLVVIYHYFPVLAPNGFLGVDIFFVISGFVISGSLFSYPPNLTNKQTIARFYAKRFRRILPALMVCVVLVFFALVVLTSHPSRDTFFTGGTSLIGLSNIVLFDQEADYFAQSSQINAFTHTWSLGVEEQFYLIFPLIGLSLGVFGARNRRPSGAALSILFVLILLSFGSYTWMNSANSIAAFYLSPFRFWELLIGCIAFLLSQSKYRFTWPHALNGLFVVVLIGCVFWKIDFPVLITALTCVSTAFLLLSIKNENLIGWGLFLNAKPINYIGRISYSLYLYHWPALVIATVTIGNSTPAFLIALCLSCILASASYHLVEIPFRRPGTTERNGRYIAISLALSLIVGVLVAGTGTKVARFLPFTLFDFVDVVPHTPWDDIPCHGYNRLSKMQDPLLECLGSGPNSSPGDIFLLGDSHAAQLTFPLKLIADAMKTEFFFINRNQQDDFPFNLINENKSRWGVSLDQILQNADAGDTVILAFHRGHLNQILDAHLSVSDDTSPNEKSINLANNLNRLAPKLSAKGVRLILVLDTPLLSYKTQVETCALQVHLWGSTVCTVSKQQDLRTRTRQQDAFEAVAAEFKHTVTVIDPAIVLYADDKDFNPIAADGSYRMIDWNHLSQSEANKLTGLFRDALLDD